MDHFFNEFDIAIESIVCPEEIHFCNNHILSAEDQSTSTSLRTLSLSSLVVSFEIELEALCTSSSCSSEAISNALQVQVMGDLRTAIENGSLVNMLRAASVYLDALLANAIASFDLLEALVPTPALQADWFPDWTSQSHTCLNDNAPNYMEVHGTYFESSLESCCQKYVCPVVTFLCSHPLSNALIHTFLPNLSLVPM